MLVTSAWVTSRKRARRASTNGPYGRPPSLSSRQAPSSTVAPSRRARRPSSATRRDFPTPASPPTMTTAGSPACAFASCAARRASSTDRPTNGGPATSTTAARSYAAPSRSWQSPLSGDVRQNEPSAELRPGPAQERSGRRLRPSERPRDLRTAEPLGGHDDGCAVGLREPLERAEDESGPLVPHRLVLGRRAELAVHERRGIPLRHAHPPGAA